MVLDTVSPVLITKSTDVQISVHRLAVSTWAWSSATKANKSETFKARLYILYPKAVPILRCGVELNPRFLSGRNQRLWDVPQNLSLSAYPSPKAQQNWDVCWEWNRNLWKSSPSGHIMVQLSQTKLFWCINLVKLGKPLLFDPQKLSTWLLVSRWTNKKTHGEKFHMNILIPRVKLVSL